MANLLRDYRCCYCGHKEELFDDEEHEICGQCGQPGLQRSLSPLNISTGSRPKIDPTGELQNTGVTFRVAAGQIIGSMPIVAGEEIKIKPGEKTVVAIGPDPNPDKIRLLAHIMDSDTEKPTDKNKLH